MTRYRIQTYYHRQSSNWVRISQIRSDLRRSSTMKITIIIFTCCLLTAWFAACGEDPNLSEGSVGNDDDDNLSTLERALIAALDKSPGERITTEDLATLTHLEIFYVDTPYGGLLPLDLTGLEDCINLTTLNLFGNTISDLSPLVGLTKLTNLNLGLTSISDLSPLVGLTKLTNLNLSSNRITDINPLKGLVNLEQLDLRQNRITGINPLTELIHLEKLYLNDNMIVDLKPLVDNLGLVNENPVHREGGFNIRADVVGVSGNPLSDASKNEHIPALEARGVIVRQ